MTEYKEPILTVAVLDYCKPCESHICLKSIREHVKVDHKIIFCDNGSGEDYPMQFVRDGLVDQLIVNKKSEGLGIGTRDLMNASFSPFTIMMQNDQFFCRDFSSDDLNGMVSKIGERTFHGYIATVTLAGTATPLNRYGERAHLTHTSFYKDMERKGALGYAGAGKYHSSGLWREAQIQEIYERENLIHWMPLVTPWVRDNGVYGLRDMGDAGVYCHRTDTKQLWVIAPPVGPRNPSYPKVTDAEYTVIFRGEWPDGQIPEMEKKDSFECWQDTDLVKMQDDYMKDLRRRFKDKRQ